MNRVRLLVFNAALGPLDYRVPDGMAIEPGSVVIAPLGPRQILGIVWRRIAFPRQTLPTRACDRCSKPSPCRHCAGRCGD